jgi:hypothetical protein
MNARPKTHSGAKAETRVADEAWSVAVGTSATMKSSRDSAPDRVVSVHV